MNSDEIVLDESEKKEKNLGKELTLELFAKSSIKIDDNAICMYVKTGSKVSNLTSFAFRNLEVFVVLF